MKAQEDAHIQAEVHRKAHAAQRRETRVKERKAKAQETLEKKGEEDKGKKDKEENGNEGKDKGEDGKPPRRTYMARKESTVLGGMCALITAVSSVPRPPHTRKPPKLNYY